ncbi:hypothetical protein [Priestia endophytica]|uniref:hypothetical protein n=1 Tax=Priestia endophytica TaxID=135735 RepID=UPI00124C0CC4|nr:hypothetical protein [Priestia endophytica]KAB2494246.1 hypothetical protein F8155_11560 [Priestia endophytica]
MKKNFLSELKVDNSFYIYGNYELKEDLFFSENNMSAILYEGYAPTKVIPLTKDLPIKDLFIKSPMYGENINGQIERIGSQNEQKKYKNKAAYLVAPKTITSLEKKDYLKNLFPNTKVTTEYSLDKFGKTLYTELAKVDFSNFTNLIDFCKTWGLPTGVTVSVLEKRIPVSDINIIWMSLDDFYTKLHEYQRVFSYFKALNTNNLSKLPTVPKEGEHIKDHASRMLEKEMKEKSLFSFKIEGKTPFSVFADLFEAAYFYLKLSIESNAEMSLCENCGHLFEVTHQRRRFCSVLPGRKRSSCEMAYNNRLKKEKKQKGGF